MKRIFLLSIISLSAVLWGQSAQEIVDKADSAFKAERVYSTSKMTVYKSGKAQPTQELESYSMKKNGKTYSLSLYLAPRRMKGTANLMVGDDLWVRFSSTGRVRKLSSSAKKNSAGGSDFSYADMGDGSQGLSEKYNPKLVGSKTVSGQECYEIELLAKSDKSPYEKMVVMIEKENFTYLLIDYYENSAKIKTMTFSDYRTVDGNLYPFAYTMESHVKQSRTEVVIGVFETNSPKVVNRLFTKGYLESIR